MKQQEVLFAAHLVADWLQVSQVAWWLGSFPCSVSLLVLSWVCVLEALAEAAPLGLPCSIDTFQPESKLHRIILEGVQSPLPFPTLSKCLNGLIHTTAPSRGLRPSC